MIKTQLTLVYTMIKPLAIGILQWLIFSHEGQRGVRTYVGAVAFEWTLAGIRLGEIMKLELKHSTQWF